MIFTWFKIFNLDEFLALGLVSKAYTFELEGVGVSEILVVHGNEVSMIFRDVMLPINFLDKNPFAMDGFACYAKDNGDVYLGIAVPNEN